MKNIMFLYIFSLLLVIIINPLYAAVGTTVMFPSGGESLERGATYPFQWRTSAPGQVFFTVRQGARTYPLALGQPVSAAAPYYLVTVSKDWPTASDYRFVITDRAGAVLAESARPWHVIAPPGTRQAKINQLANALSVFNQLLTQWRPATRL